MLLALLAAVAVVTPVVIPPLPVVEACEFGGKGIRRVVRYHQNQVRQCFMTELQYRGTPGTYEAVLHFQVGTSGAVEWSRTSGEVAPAITRCLDAQVLTWQFGAGTSSTMDIEYPVRFVLNSW